MKENIFDGCDYMLVKVLDKVKKQYALKNLMTLRF